MTRQRIIDLIASLRPLAKLDHPSEMIRRFTPNWFAATMGIR